MLGFGRMCGGFEEINILGIPELKRREVKVMTDFSRCLIECRDEYKYNVEAVELLIRNHLVNMQQYDLHLAQVRS